MALSIPTFPNRFDSATPLQGVYAYIARLQIAADGRSGLITLHIHPNAEAWRDEPMDRLTIQFGEFLPPATANESSSQMITLDELEADPAYAALGLVLYTAAKSHPLLKDAEIVA